MKIQIHSRGKQRLLTAGLGMLLGAMSLSNSASADVCPEIYHKGKLSLPFMPAFLEVDDYRRGQGLTVSSFLNASRSSTGVFTRFERDLVARIPRINNINFDTFSASSNVQIVSDIMDPLNPQTVWPNHPQKVPEDVMAHPWNWYEWAVVPQGFLSDARPGRLTLIKLNGGYSEEFLIHQSTQLPLEAGVPDTDPANSPRGYHKVVWHDMDGDGLKDAVTVRMGFKVQPNFYGAYGELVYFKNPGAALQPNVPWQEVLLYGGPTVNRKGPDIDLAMHDFDGDGQPEIVATKFFSGTSTSAGLIEIYAPPVGQTWADVNAGNLARNKIISQGQGLPFGIKIIDLNGDGKKDVLATNHQHDACVGLAGIPGRVYAIESPEDGDLFGGVWTTRILKNNIRPQPSLPGTVRPGRLAPGIAIPFWPVKFMENISKPHIVVGGDEAGKVWVLTPQDSTDPDNWNYDSGVVFDINTYYGANTTQTRYPAGHPAEGRTNGTIGGMAVRYTNNSDFGAAEFYIPAYEGRDIHVMSYQKPTPESEAYSCSPDVRYACPVQ